MNIRSPTSNPALQTIELSICPVEHDPWFSGSCQLGIALEARILTCRTTPMHLGSRFVDCVDAWVVVPCPNSDVELWSIPCQLKWLILNVLLRMVWPVASLTVAIELQQFMITLYVLFFRLCQFFSWINLFEQLLKVYLVCFFHHPFSKFLGISTKHHEVVHPECLQNAAWGSSTRVLAALNEHQAASGRKLESEERPH